MDGNRLSLERKEGERNVEYQAEIRIINEHVIYYKEYFVQDMGVFYESLAKRNFLQELSDKVMAENPQIGLTDPDYNVILYADGAHKEQDVSIEFCDAVTAFGTDTDAYRFRSVPEFTALTILHKGPYETLSDAYVFAYQWMKQNGYRQAGNPRNSTIHGCWDRHSKEEYLTEIQIPVEITR